MKSLIILSSIVAVALVSAQVASADPIIRYWTDDVEEYSSQIQNYGWTIMDDTTEFWLEGEPDCDADENGFAWDPGDPDYVGGWRASHKGQYIVVHFDTPLWDGPDNDLGIALYGGPIGKATVWASTDGTSYANIGTLGGGTQGYLRNEFFDFGGLIASSVHYIKVVRDDEAIGSGSAMFFDAFGGVYMPADFNEDTAVDVSDLGILAANYGTTSGMTWGEGDVNGDEAVDVSDLGVLAAYYGTYYDTGTTAASAVPEPAALSLILGALLPFGLVRRRNRLF
ncbi:MAG: hypothetical protein JXM70_26490 [Pirellulales bacterium]|nr:hypothetical protein [Pirellulales bacterium]